MGDREAKLLSRTRPRLADVIARNRDRVERWQVLGGVGEEIGDEPHRGLRRIDVGAAGNVFLENVVLHGPAYTRGLDPLFFGDELIEQEEQRGGGVDRHRGRDLAQWKTIEKQSHVLD